MTRSARIPLYSRCVLHSHLLARAFPFKPSPILLLSYPRSGSSWAGAMLGRSPDVAYLREPVNQPYLAGVVKETVVDPESSEAVLRTYARLADRAFAGALPWRAEDYIECIEDFALRRRRHKVLLIKEVNPLATGFYVRTYRPRVVMLLRHPAAVADSYERMGWLGGEFEEFGHRYGTHMARALATAAEAPIEVVRFEDLAIDPRGRFPALFARLGLRLPVDFESAVEELCEAGKGARGAYDLARSSRHEAFKWECSLGRDEVAAVMRGYLRSPLPYYRDAV
jgi:hypothetical protein